MLSCGGRGPGILSAIRFSAAVYWAVFFSGLLLGQGGPRPPALPQAVPPSAQPATSGAIRAVSDTGNAVTNGTNLQNAYDAASCGDQIILDAGAEYRNSFVFNKQCSSTNWIQVVSANLTSIPTLPYVTPSQANNQNSAPAAPNTANFAKLTSGNGAAVLTCTNSINVPGTYNYFGGLEVTNPIAAPLIWCTNALSEALVSQLPDHIIFDRIYVHGIAASSAEMFPRGFVLVGSNVSIVNSYVADIYSTQQDSQAILFATGPGPYLVRNNFLESSGENILSGGTGKTPGYSCTIADNPAPTTTTATVEMCIDAAGGTVDSPAAGTCVMFYTAADAPYYTPDDWTCVTGNTNGSLTFNRIPSPPVLGAGKIAWGIVPADITITGNVIYKPPAWNPASADYDGVSGATCTIAANPAPTASAATITACIDTGANPVAMPAPGSTVIFYINGSTVQVTLTAINTSTGEATFPAQSAAPTAGTGQCLLGPFRDVKNLLETKYGVRWYVNGNLFQHVWNGGQGLGININSTDQNGDCPWCVVQDVTISNNIFQDLYATLAIIPAQSYTGPAPGPLARVLIQNNLFWPQYSGTILGFAGFIVNGGAPPKGSANGADSVQIIHNHLLGPGTNIHVGSSISEGMPQNYTNLVIKDNLTEFDQYRWLNQCITGPDGKECIASSLSTGGSAGIATNAVINTGALNGGQGVSDSMLTTRYGSMILGTMVDTYSAAGFLDYSAINTDYHNYALATGSPFKGLASDGTDPGVNFAQLDAALFPRRAPNLPRRR